MTTPPAWWRTELKQIEDCLATVRRGKVEDLAHSPGGRPVYAVAYGPAPVHQATSNLSGAMGCGDPRVYKDETLPQAVILVAGCHGAEAEAVNGALNLIQAMETGRDFAGVDRSKLADLAEHYRLVIIPVLNPDGRARSPASMLGVGPEAALHLSQGTWKDGSPIDYPTMLEESMAVFELFLHWGLSERFSPRQELFLTMLDSNGEATTYYQEK